MDYRTSRHVVHIPYGYPVFATECRRGVLSGLAGSPEGAFRCGHKGAPRPPCGFAGNRGGGAPSLITACPGPQRRAARNRSGGAPPPESRALLRAPR